MRLPRRSRSPLRCWPGFPPLAARRPSSRWSRFDPSEHPKTGPIGLSAPIPHRQLTTQYPPASLVSINERGRQRMSPDQDRRIAEVVTREESRLRNFIRRRVADPSDAEDILQDVFSELVEANQLLMPIDHLSGWL